MNRPRFFMPSADRRLGDRYELIECLGDGSHGWVWKAHRLSDNAIAALRIPKDQGSSNSELEEGVVLVNTMPHPNVVSKPHNILVCGQQAKVTDFGSSLQPEEVYVRSRENGGTILYSAPEILGILGPGRRKADPFLADIYSLGVLLYYLLTSRLPHETSSQVERHTPFPRPREINSSVCPAAEQFVLRCLSERPA